MDNEIICKDINKTHYKECKLCKKETVQIPIRKIYSIMMVEHYCPYCEISEISYENFEHM